MAESSASLHAATLTPACAAGPGPWLDNLAKRCFDFSAALVGLVLLAPFFVWIAWKIRRDSPGPVFFRGPRLGWRGRIFQIWKFRTMYESEASYQGPPVTAQDDSRITPVGRWLRSSKVNELPQLMNVLAGEMSLVGPRPEDPGLASSLPVDSFQEVLSVRPGITSPASVLYRNEEALLKKEGVVDTYLDEIVPSKLRLDQLYVRHRTFWLDLDILLWTFLVLLPRPDAFSPAERGLFSGPISRLVRRYVSWFAIDAVTTFLAMGAAGLFWRSFGPLNVGWPSSIVITLVFAFLFSVTGALLGVNRISWSQASLNDAFDLLPAAGLAMVMAILLNHAWGAYQPNLPNLLVAFASVLATLGFVAVRYRSRLFSALLAHLLKARGAAHQAHERALIVGGGESGQFAAWLLTHGTGADLFHVTGYVDDDLYKQGMRIRGVRVLGGREDIPRLVREHDIGLIVFAIHNISADERRRVLEICAGAAAKVVDLHDFLSLFNAYMEPRTPQPASHTAVEAAQFLPCLDRLEQAAGQGNLEAVQEEIVRLRRQVGQAG